jgi:hypothetical protein
MERRRKTINMANTTYNADVKLSHELYSTTIHEVQRIAKEIKITKTDCDGRMDSAIKELPFLNELKDRITQTYPTWDVVISPPRAPCDVMINSIRMNLKLTDCKSSDNSMNKPSIYYSITGLTTYPYSSNWNIFYEHLLLAKSRNQIKTLRDTSTEYHYIVKNKITGDVLLKSIFDIHTYISNASNDLQIHWKHEFEHADYFTEEKNYLQKVQSLLVCIQTSVQEMMKRTHLFAEADISALFSPE